MDLKSVIILAIILFLTFLLIKIFSIKSRNKEQKILAKLIGFAQENESTITKYNHWSNTLIGIDESSLKKVFFIRKNSHNEFRKVIDLSEVQKCRVVNVTRTVGEGKNKQSVIDKIELRFTFNNKNTPEIALEFYNSDFDSLTLSGELQLAENWLQIINKNLKM